MSVSLLQPSVLTKTLAECLARAIPALAAVAKDVVEERPLLDFDDENFLKPTTLSLLLEEDPRLLGMRDELLPTHPIVRELRASLTEEIDDVPPPDMEMVTAFGAHGDIAFEGKICLLDGMPIPLGKKQTSFFVATRWRPLFHPLARKQRIYIGDSRYDRLFATDALQQPILGITTRKYRDVLVDLQHAAPDLFVALWFRRFPDLKNIMLARAKLTAQIRFFDAPMRGGPLKKLLIAFAVMSELERLFEIAKTMKFGDRNEERVTRETVLKALEEARSWDDILKLPGKLGDYLRGCPLHTRANHRSMNLKQDPLSNTCMLARVREAISNSLVFQNRYRRVEKINGELPVLFFMGLELAKFFPTMLEHLHFDLILHRKDGGKEGLTGRQEAERRLMQMRLSILVMSNICEKTAHAMAAPLQPSGIDELLEEAAKEKGPSGKPDAAAWRRIYPFAVIYGSIDLGEDHNTLLEDLVGRRNRAAIELVTDKLAKAFQNRIDNIGATARECTPSVGEPGWTMGARFEAWGQPEAESGFLRRCTQNLKYDRKLDRKAQKIEQRIVASGLYHPKAIKRPRLTGLPLQHPFGHIHDQFRDLFDPLQLTDVIGSAAMSLRWMQIENSAHRAAERLPAVSPLTQDPWLSERMFSRPEQSALKSNARRRGTIKRDQLRLHRDLLWQRYGG